MGRQHGFTLLELMIGLGVLAIVLAMAAPSFREMTLNNRLVTQTNEFIGALNLARSEAGKRAVNVVVAAADASDGADEWGPGWTMWPDDDGDGTQDAGEATLRVGEAVGSALGASLSIDSPTGADTITYQSTGFFTPAGSQFVFCDNRIGEVGRTITVSATGRASVADFNCT